MTANTRSSHNNSGDAERASVVATNLMSEGKRNKKQLSAYGKIQQVLTNKEENWPNASFNSNIYGA